MSEQNHVCSARAGALQLFRAGSERKLGRRVGRWCDAGFRQDEESGLSRSGIRSVAVEGWVGPRCCWPLCVVLDLGLVMP